MNIGNAIKIGVAVIAGIKLATGSYKMCKSMHSSITKHDYLVSKGVPLEELIFADNEKLNKLMEQYA